MEPDPDAPGVREYHTSFAWSDGTGESDFNSLLGKRVRLLGLKARPELNGCAGRVFSWHADKGRAGVVLDDREEEGTLAIKAENLEVVETPNGASTCAATEASQAAQADEAGSSVDPPEPAVDAERLAQFYARATSTRGAMARETQKAQQKHASLRQQERVARWYDEHQAHVDELKERPHAGGEEGGEAQGGDALSAQDHAAAAS